MRKLNLKWLLIFSVVSSVFLLSEKSLARPDGWSLYMAAGQNWTFPATVRVGVDEWEYGIISPGVVGANKVFPNSGSSFYSTLGFGVNNDGDPKGLAFQAGAGYETLWFWGIWFRAEMFALANTNGKFISHGLVGIAYDF
ncbi:MAG: hypothetical protein ACK5P6_02715 [Pseudobdellovibrionaceae bacterium]